MRFDRLDPQVVARVTVRKGSISDACKTYTPSSFDWFDWRTLWEANGQPQLKEYVRPEFTACIVSYEIYNKSWRTGDENRHLTYTHPRGLSRRDSLRILRRAGVRPPNSVEMFLLATYQRNLSGSDRELPKISTCHNNRRIMCPIPINPEFPNFLYFGKGGGDGSFKHESYNEHDEQLYFAADGKRYGFEYQFPLLIGIEDPKQ